MVSAEFSCAIAPMPAKVLLASTTPWPTVARLAAAFSGMSWQVEVLAPADAAACHSRFVDRVHDYSGLMPLASLKRALRRSRADLVLPCDDRAVSQLVALHDSGCRGADRKLADLIATSLGTPSAYATAMNRADLIAAAAAEGVAVPATCQIGSEADLEAGLRELGLPAVLKSDGSWGGDGVSVIHSREQARAAWRRMSDPVSLPRGVARAVRRRDVHHLAAALAPVRPRLSLQTYIAGVPATSAFACWRGEVLAAVHCDVVASSGGTGPASVVRRTDDPAMAAAARKIARRLGLSGLHGLDFIRDASGQVHLLEMNPRVTQICALAMGPGCDLVSALAARITGVDGPVRTAIGNDLVALFPQEWSRDPASAWLHAAHHDVPWDDPALVRFCIGETDRGALWQHWLTTLRPDRDGASLRPGNHPAIASEL